MKHRLSLFLRESFFALVAMIMLFWAAKGVIHILHTPPCTVQCVGGIVVTLMGIRATLHLTNENSWEAYPGKSSASLPFITPIAMPLIIGPSWLAACCAFVGKHFSNPISMLTIALSWLLISCATLILQLFTNPKKTKTLLATQTILGLFVTIVGTQILISGLQSTFL